MVINVNLLYPWCESCPKVNPELTHDVPYANHKLTEKVHMVRCYHDDFCQVIFEHMKEYMNNEQKS